MNLDLLLAPISIDAPCGDNLEYDPAYMHVVQLARGKPEQQFGDTIIPAVEPDWRAVEHEATRVLMRSKDLRLLLLLAQAWTALRGLPGYADGLQLLSEALARYWPTLQPPMAPEGEDDPLMRINLLRELGDGYTLAKLLRQNLFFPEAAAGLTFADALAFLDGGEPPGREYPGGPARLNADIQRGINALAPAAARVITAIGRINDLARQHLGDSAQPEMPLLLQAMATLSRYATVPAAAGGHDGGRIIETPAASPAPMPAARHGAGIGSRDEAYQALESVKAYFNQYEPSHPAPLMIARVQLLMSQDFMAIVRNLAPEALGRLEQFFDCETHARRGPE